MYCNALLVNLKHIINENCTCEAIITVKLIKKSVKNKLN